jgi:site-specific DNA-methyltransferase (adenine-specific)
MKPIEYFENRIINYDCLKVMPHIPDKSIDMILCDLPYGTTQCKWDTIIPFEPLWKQYKRIIKPNGAIVLFGNEPFSSFLRMSNIEWFKYDWIWEKTKPSGHLNAKKQPMRKTEIISVFYQKQCTYNPQGLIAGTFNNNRPSRDKKVKGEYVHGQERQFGTSEFTNYPNNILNFPNPNNKTVHPTQKPTEICEYLIKTYTNEGDLVLDNCIGSGTTALACKNTKRHFIGIELNKEYCEIARKRLEEVN